MNKDVTTANKVPTRWHRMLLGSIAMLFSGIIYSWSILKAPLSEEFGWSPSALALNFTLTLCFFCIGSIIASQISKRIGQRLTVIVSCVLLFLGFFFSSRITGNILVLYVSYGCMAGLGIGMIYIMILSVTNAWFPDKKGTSAGVLMMSFGLGSLILGKVAEVMFKSESFGWRGAYLTLGICISIIIAICALFLKTPPETASFPAPKIPKGQKISESFETRDYTTKEMLKRFSFWRFFFYAILVCAVGSSVISFARDLALSVGASAALASTLAGILSLFNGVGRIVFGLIFDAIGRKKTMLLSNAITIFAPLMVLISLKTNSLSMCIIGLCLTGMGYGSAAMLSSAFTSAFYGLKHFPLNYSIANTILIPSSFSATLASSLFTATGSYVASFYMLLSFAVIALFINMSIEKP